MKTIEKEAFLFFTIDSLFFRGRVLRHMINFALKNQREKPEDSRTVDDMAFGC